MSFSEHTTNSAPSSSPFSGAIRLCHATSRMLDILCRTALLLSCAGMVTVIGAQVVFRYGFNHSLFWAEELGRVLLVQLTFFGAAVAYRAEAHIGVDTLVRRLSPSMRQMVHRLMHTVCLCLFCVMVVYGFRFADLLSLQMTTTLGVSRQIPFLAVPLSGCVMCVHSLCFIFAPLSRHRENQA